MGAVENPAAPDLRETMAADSTKPSATRRKCPTHQSPIMIEVPLARIPEEPGAVIPHAGISEGGVRQLTSLP
jgi:hypothetical protein